MRKVVFVVAQWRRKLVELGGTRNKILVQGGRYNVNIFIAYIVDNTGTITSQVYRFIIPRR